MAIQSKGLNLGPKLKQEHVKLTSYARMRVDLAAQVYKCTCIYACIMHVYMVSNPLYMYTNCITCVHVYKLYHMYMYNVYVYIHVCIFSWK